MKNIFIYWIISVLPLLYTLIDTTPVMFNYDSRCLDFYIDSVGLMYIMHPLNSFFFLNHSALVSQANCMTLTASNLFSSHSCIGVTRVKPHKDSNSGPQHERQMTYQLSYPSPIP